MKYFYRSRNPILLACQSFDRGRLGRAKGRHPPKMAGPVSASIPGWVIASCHCCRRTQASCIDEARERTTTRPRASSCPSWARTRTLLIQSRYRRASGSGQVARKRSPPSIGARSRLETVRPRCPPSEAYARSLAILVRSPLLPCLRSRPRRVLVQIRRLSLVAYQDQAASL
jgi:hypothetical protein